MAKITGHYRVWRLLLMAMLLALAFVAFWPSPVDQPVQDELATVLTLLHEHGIPRWFNYGFVEASANVAIFVPLGFVGAFAFPNKRWWQIGALGLLISCCMELGQLLFLHNRVASPLDLAANALGAIIGGLLALLMAGTLEARRLSAADL